MKPNVSNSPAPDRLSKAGIRTAELMAFLVVSFTLVAMMGCVAVAMTVIAKGFVLTVIQRPLASATAAPLVSWTLSGLELFFLAPLPYLAFLSVVKLVRATFDFERNKDRNALEEAHKFIGRVKHLIIGLMIAVVATEMIHRVVGGSGAALDIQSLAAMLGLILVLTFNYWVSGPKS
jgi:hypothetical protein